jgi:hypothetical protein
MTPSPVNLAVVLTGLFPCAAHVLLAKIIKWKMIEKQD